MERKLTALIVDDEEKALELLMRLLKDTLHFSEIRTANSTQVAASELRLYKPDLLFLDIKMPGKDGIEFLKDLRSAGVKSEIVFVTAHDQFVLNALRNRAFDYLLKPVNRQELANCIQNFKVVKREPDFGARLDQFLTAYAEDNKLRFNTRTGYFFVDPADILYFESNGNYSTIYTGDKQMVCSLQLGMVQGLLPLTGFIRLGRSLIVNFKYVSSVDRKKNQLFFEKQGQQYSIHVSNSQLRELEKRQTG